MDTNFEQIVPWNGAQDTGKDVRLKWQRNFDRIKANFEELTDLFEKVNLGTDEAPAWAIRAKYGLYTDSWLSAKGKNPSAGSTPVAGATELSKLTDVLITSPADGQVLAYDTALGKWVNSEPVAGGLDDEELAEYLTTNRYATQDWITQQGYATQQWASGQFALRTVAINAGTGLTGGGNLTASRTLSLATVGTAGTYTKVTVDAYGRVTGHSSLAAGDIPTLSISKISGLQSALDDKLDAADFTGLFEKVYVSGYGYAIRAKLALYSEAWISAKGMNSDAGGTVVAGASSWDEIEGKPSTLAGYGIQTEADGRYVNVSGDTMTGALTVPRIKFTNTYDSYIVQGYSEAYGDYIEVNATGASGVNATLRIGNVGSHFTFNGNKVWHAGNDGAGSGLDADTLDGKHLSDIINGNVASATVATRLQTQHTFWGQPYNGTQDVSGDITGAGTIEASGNLNSFNFVRGKSINTAPSNFQQDIFGTTNWGYKLTAIRWNGLSGYYGLIYSPMIAVATSDTHAYLSLSYLSADTCYIGGGSGNSITWQARLFNDSMSLVPKNSEYSVGSASIPWYEMHAARFMASDFLQVGQGRIYYDASTGALFVEKADGTQCGFYATGFLSAKGANSDAGGAVAGGGSGEVHLKDIVDMADEWKLIVANYPEDHVLRWPTWSEVTGKPSTFAPSAHTHAWSEISGKPSWITTNDGSGSGIDADLLDGTHKAGLFTGMTYSGNKLSVTVGGTTRSVTINAASGSPSVSLSSTSSTDLTVNVGGNTNSITELFATHLRSHYEATNVPNIDNITYNGIYNWGGSTAGTKPSAGYGLLLHISNYTSKPSTMSWCWRAQLGFGTDGHLFYRISVNSSTWQAWKMIM